jgi:two-component system OmpR family response regulator
VRVLVVDDEVNIAELLDGAALRGLGGPDRAHRHEGRRDGPDFRPDAVVLDMMLPDFDGLEVLRRMRADGPTYPCSSSPPDAVEDRVAGLTAGGDDYVTKPFSLEEVVARLRG